MKCSEPIRASSKPLYKRRRGDPLRSPLLLLWGLGPPVSCAFTLGSLSHVTAVSYAPRKCCQAAHRTCTALIVVAIATAVMVMATAVELASNGPLGRLPVSDVNVEPPRVFKELQA